MRNFLVRVVCLIVLTLAVSGCPSTGLLAIGLWFFSLDGSVLGVAAELLDEGVVVTFTASDFPEGAIDSFTGDLEWWQSGSRFVMIQDLETNLIVYRGVVASDGMSISGTSIDNSGDEGTFTAEFQE